MNRSAIIGLAFGAALTSLLYANLSARGSNAAGSAESSVAVVDVIRIFNEYQRQIDLNDELQAIRGNLNLEAQTRRERLQNLQQEVDQMSPTDPARKAKLDEAVRLQIEFKNWFEINEAAMTRELAVWTEKVYSEINEVAGEVAREQGVDVMLYKSVYQPGNPDPQMVREQIRQRQVIYASPNADLTQQTLDRLNAKYRAQPKTKMLQIP